MGPETCKLTDDVGAVFAFCSLLALQNLKIKAIRESDFYRLILSIGMGSEIIGRAAPTSSISRTDIIGKYRDHRQLSTGGLRCIVFRHRTTPPVSSTPRSLVAAHFALAAALAQRPIARRSSVNLQVRSQEHTAERQSAMHR